MVNIIIYKKKSLIQGYEISGHAEYAEYGHDIVCSAVSMLGQTILMSLVEIANLKEDNLDYEIIEEKAYLKVKIIGNIDKYTEEKTQILLDTFDLGIRSVVQSYPENVTLKYREV